MCLKGDDQILLKVNKIHFQKKNRSILNEAKSDSMLINKRSFKAM